MNKLTILIVALLLSTVSYCKEIIDITIDKEQVLQLDLDNQKFYLIPVNPNSTIKDNQALFGYQPDRRNPIACEGTLLCYMCCTGHTSVNKQFCDYHSNNWQKGKDCDC
ncbi:TPA: hypothetical protein ACT9IC_001478 [Legionella pneumophila]